MHRKYLVQRSDGRIQQYAIRPENIERFYSRIGKKNGRVLWEKKIYRSQSALTGYKTVVESEDIRVWRYEKDNKGPSVIELEKELYRFIASLRLKGIADHSDTRTERNQLIAQNEIEPPSAPMSQWFGYARINGYVYHGTKFSRLWAIKKGGRA